MADSTPNESRTPNQPAHPDTPTQPAPSQPASSRPRVAETIVDVPETILDDTFQPLLLTTDHTLDATSILATDGRMAALAQTKTFTLHHDRLLGSGSQGIVVEATDDEGTTYAAKVSYAPLTVQDKRNKKAVLSYLISLMDEHPLQDAHYKQTHLMPVYAYGTITEGTETYEVTIMALCEASLDMPGGCSFAYLRDHVIPETATGLRNLHVEGIVHRDIKPKNLYLLHDSIVLGDFGISSLLDAGRDTGATVFDKRTPGYSPHSSVIQRENDWYALGYTIWTLYNGGVHPHQALIDADDLSAVLAGKHPVAFVPHRPEEASLGELIYGLTLESARGRLGYADIQAWLEDPASFHFDNPFERPLAHTPYQFAGVSYTDNAALAHAMADAWSEAQNHLYAQTLETHLSNTGQHDLAVCLHRITSGDAYGDDKDLGLSVALTLLNNDPTQFCWHGDWVKRDHFSDSLFASLTASPEKFYATCAHPLEYATAFRKLLAAFANSADYEAVVQSAYRALFPQRLTQEASGAGTAANAGDIPITENDIFLRADKLLSLFEILCENKQAVHQFYGTYGFFGNAVWIHSHISDYHGNTEQTSNSIAKIKAFTLPDFDDPAATIESLRTTLAKLDSLTRTLIKHAPKNPYERMIGIQADEVSLARVEDYCIASVYDQLCTIGFALIIAGEGRRDSLCDYSLLRRAAIMDARMKATKLEDDAEKAIGSTVKGDPISWRVILIISTVIAFLFAASSFEDLSQICTEGSNLYGAALAAAGGITPYVWWNNLMQSMGWLPAMNFNAVVLNVGALAFIVCTATILITRVLEILPVATAKSKRLRAGTVTGKIRRIAATLEEYPLQVSIDRLFENKPAGSPEDIKRIRTLLAGPENRFARAERKTASVYRASLFVLMAAIILSTITWLPATDLPTAPAATVDEIKWAAWFVQAAMLIVSFLYFRFIYRVSDDGEPNMIAVMFVGLVFFLCCVFFNGF